MRGKVGGAAVTKKTERKIERNRGSEVAKKQREGN